MITFIYINKQFLKTWPIQIDYRPRNSPNTCKIKALLEYLDLILHFLGHLLAPSRCICIIFSGNTYFYICDHLKLRKLKAKNLFF